MDVTFSLPDELSRFIEDQLAAGHYASSSDLIQDALRLLDEGQRDREEPEVVRVHPPDLLGPGVGPGTVVGAWRGGSVDGGWAYLDVQQRVLRRRRDGAFGG